MKNVFHWRSVFLVLLILLLASLLAGCASIASGIGQNIPWPWNKPHTQPEQNQAYDYGDDIADAPSDIETPSDIDWPDNEYTRLIPRPGFKVNSVTQTEDTFYAALEAVDTARLRSYVRQLRARGFTVNPRIQDQTSMGMVVYNYTAENDAGYEVNVYCAQDTAGLALRKP